ncbi:XVIPCD domain-containing protein [Dyella lutea]|uniref:X-Tfes XVIPCD domain-containing protein n=1 Tax=Dyella lutea TaxID=2950441 RepID=A0ABT1F6M0_9GAMM|nr:XVIPCD domain-containing protein [Dyella lutea]MCP1372985.1 hypothetical protein [Dyella lutea]
MDQAWNENAGLSADAYKDHKPQSATKVHGVAYTILATVNSSPTGFQATAYQRVDNGNIKIEFRGTQALGDWLRDDRVDFGMVKSRIDAQLPEADAFTRRVLAQARTLEPQYGHPLEVSVAGHSLGGVPAEVMAFRYKLSGEAFNGYGAVDLDYGVPQGQPGNAPRFINHVRATDIVSAASRHYGTVRVYATEQDVAALQAGRYLNTPDPHHPANPMITGQLGAHFISNFAPEPGKGESILTAANEARYEQYHAAFDHFRHDVLASRVALHDLLNDTNREASKAHLAGQLEDAIDVARYKVAVRGLEYVTGLDAAGTSMQRIAAATQALETVVQVNVAATAERIHDTGEALDEATRVASRALREGGAAWHQASGAAADTAAQWRPAAPLAADTVGLGSRIVGVAGDMAADDLATQIDATGRLAHAASGWASREMHEAGAALHESASWVSRQWRDAGDRLQHTMAGLASTRAHDALRDVLEDAPRLDDPRHPDHPMFLRGWTNVQRIDAGLGRPSDQCSANLTGMLVVACKAQGMTRIDAVTLSEDGSRAVATEQVLGRTFQRHAVVDTAQAVRTPLEQSSVQAAGMPVSSVAGHAAPAQAQAPIQAPMAAPPAMQR